MVDTIIVAAALAVFVYILHLIANRIDHDNSTDPDDKR